MARQELEEQKSELRARALARRDALPPQERAAAAAAIAARGLPLRVPPGAIVAGFVPMRSEINPMPLLHNLHAAGAGLALPVVASREKPLIMRTWTFGAPLKSGVWGIREPMPDAGEVFPDILLVPLLAFDRRGHRIGYGAGYYDRTIQHLRAMKPIVAAGIAFAAQEVASVPTTPRDAALDLVLTEHDVIKCEP
jgi:5-formyltetrahydrofolate cyclo-ligase